MNSSFKPSGYIYLITCEGTNRVKIGYSGNPESRLRALMTGAPGKLAIARTWPAFPNDERSVHKLLADYRKHLEWFEIGIEDASFLISKALTREPSRVLKPEDFIQLEPPLVRRWPAVTLQNSPFVIIDIQSVMDRVYSSGLPGVKRSIADARLIIKKVGPIIEEHALMEPPLRHVKGGPVALKILTLGSCLESLVDYPSLFVSLNARAIDVLGDQVGRIIGEIEHQIYGDWLGGVTVQQGKEH